MVRLMFKTVVVTFGMFSALPMPRVDWTPRNMRWALDRKSTRLNSSHS